MKCIKKLVAVALAAVLALAMLTACGGNMAPSGGIVMTESMQKCVDNINAVRTRNGLSELKINTTAMEMAKRGENLYKQRMDKTITEDDWIKQSYALRNIPVEGRECRGFIEIPTMSWLPEEWFTEEEWQNMYDERDETSCATQIVIDPDAAYIGISVWEENYKVDDEVDWVDYYLIIYTY